MPRKKKPVKKMCASEGPASDQRFMFSCQNCGRRADDHARLCNPATA